MSQSPLTVTIGIPAFNEAANIGYLLKEILSQYESGFRLEKIIVNSDGSTDETAAIARAIQDPRIEVWQDGERRGQAVRQNEMTKKTNSDILVLFNADISLEGRYCLKTLVQPLLDGQADFTAANMLIMKPNTWVEKMLATSFEFKNAVFEEWRGGNNLYTCHGVARAFHRSYYEHFRIENSVAEDAYSYLFGRMHGHRYQYVPDAVVRIRLPRDLKDHFKQSTRFFQSKANLVGEFGYAFVEKEYTLPFFMTLQKGLTSFFRHPIMFPVYAAVTFFSQWKSLVTGPVSDTWDMAVSSKALH